MLDFPAQQPPAAQLLAEDLAQLIEARIKAALPLLRVARYDAARRSLTAREVSVLDHLCRGLANKEIAIALSIAEATIKVNIRTLCRAFGARNRTHLALLAVGALDR